MVEPRAHGRKKLQRRQSIEQVPTTAVAAEVAEVAKDPIVAELSAPSGQSQTPAVAISEAVVDTSASKPGEKTSETVPPAPKQAAVADATATEATAVKSVETADSNVEPERPATPPPVYTNVSPSTPQKGESSKTDVSPATPSVPSTPVNKHTFPSGGAVEDSGGSSKFGSQRKKRHSIFGKLKSVFSGDKEKK
ncbi:hypothetical protein BD410DRAFT_40315 [Rickenella mellea]|uniref:Uncharacterized protein n=1 Tax=Rickenella mellea TaxID=50990 RepID=A0A4R5XGL2_9AGAM|nr:hypothetical protein BD410DRAFT_40315 [Rickenella mellea]